MERSPEYDSQKNSGTKLKSPSQHTPEQMKGFAQQTIEEYELRVAELQMDIQQMNDEIYQIDMELKPLDEQISNYEFKLGRLQSYVSKEEESCDELLKLISKFERDNRELLKHQVMLEKIHDSNLAELESCKNDKERSRWASDMLNEAYNELREASGFKLEKYKQHLKLIFTITIEQDAVWRDWVVYLKFDDKRGQYKIVFWDPKIDNYGNLEDILNTQLQSDFTEFLIATRKAFKLVLNS